MELRVIGTDNVDSFETDVSSQVVDGFKIINCSAVQGENGKIINIAFMQKE